MLERFNGNMPLSHLFGSVPPKSEPESTKPVKFDWYAGTLRDNFMRLKKSTMVFVRPAPHYAARYGKCWYLMDDARRIFYVVSENAFGPGLNQLVSYVTERNQLKKAPDDSKLILEHALSALQKRVPISRQPIDSRLV
jgi:hypothetical protein